MYLTVEYYSLTEPNVRDFNYYRGKVNERVRRLDFYRFMNPIVKEREEEERRKDEERKRREQEELESIHNGTYFKLKQ